MLHSYTESTGERDNLQGLFYCLFLKRGHTLAFFLSVGTIPLSKDVPEAINRFHVHLK